jgi:dGTPase
VLVHDVGHPPFGHAGEAALQELMREHGGFEHNLHGLRVVDQLESRYPDWPGLNLTWEVREAIVKHSRSSGGEAAEFAEWPWPSLEAQLADVCDQIAYNAHDIDDGLTAGLITVDQLRELEIWRRLAVSDAVLSDEHCKYLGVRALINAQVLDVVQVVEQRAREWGLESAATVRTAPGVTAALSPEMAALNQDLREFLFRHVYRNYRVVRMSAKARRVIEGLFRSYQENPRQLPPGVEKAGQPLERSLCDYLAGLTDREALEEHRRLFDPRVPT